LLPSPKLKERNSGERAGGEVKGESHAIQHHTRGRDGLYVPLTRGLQQSTCADSHRQHCGNCNANLYANSNIDVATHHYADADCYTDTNEYVHADAYTQSAQRGMDAAAELSG